MASQETETDDTAEMAELRDEYPSGWRILTQHDTVSYMIDALMDAPDEHFSQVEAGRKRRREPPVRPHAPPTPPPSRYRTGGRRFVPRKVHPQFE